MFAVIYRWRLKPGREAEFREGWRRKTREITAECGSFGSRLHRSQDDVWVAYALWPNREARAACWERPVVDTEAPVMMIESVLETFAEIQMETTDDLLKAPWDDGLHPAPPNG